MEYLYAVRDKTTGKFVSNLVNPSKRFWQFKKSALTAMTSPNKHSFNGDTNNLELVTFKLVEVKEGAV